MVSLEENIFHSGIMFSFFRRLLLYPNFLAFPTTLRVSLRSVFVSFLLRSFLLLITLRLFFLLVHFFYPHFPPPQNLDLNS